MSDVFEIGQVVFDKSGNRYEYVGATKNGHFAKRIISLERIKYTENHAEFLQDIYAVRPCSKVSVAVIAILGIIAAGSWLISGGAA